MSAGLILLAAGGSRRLGSPKQLIPFQGQTLLRRAAETALASRCRPVVIVLGAQADTMQKELKGLPVTIVLNPRWEEGMASSIQAGLQATPFPEGAVIMLCDQPFVTSQLIDRLASEPTLAAAEYGGSVGVPAYFPKQFLEQLKTLSGHEGAKKILLRNPVAKLPFPEAQIDLDTPQEVERLQNQS